MTTTRLSFSRYLEHLDAESERFAEVLAETDPQARVPTCPDWSAADLLAHLTEVQSFWAAVVRGRLRTDDEVERIQAPDRPEDLECGLAALRAATFRLHSALEDTPPQTAAWTWSSEQTVGFTYRRQAHEALIHRLDAELTLGSDARTPVDPALAADGVDEALRIMVGGCPPWGTITPDASRWARVRAVDVEATWRVHPALFTGTDPKGVTHEAPDIAVAAADSPGTAAPAEIRASAEDLVCWLWGRPTVGAVERSGDGEILDALTRVLTQPIT